MVVGRGTRAPRGVPRPEGAVAAGRRAWLQWRVPRRAEGMKGSADRSDAEWRLVRGACSSVTSWGVLGVCRAPREFLISLQCVSKPLVHECVRSGCPGGLRTRARYSTFSHHDALAPARSEASSVHLRFRVAAPDVLGPETVLFRGACGAVGGVGRASAARAKVASCVMCAAPPPWLRWLPAATEG